MDERELLSCRVVCYGESFDFTPLSEALMESGRMACYHDVLCLDVEQGSCIVFPFAVVVFWNLRSDVINHLDRLMESCLKGVSPAREEECYSYITGCERHRFTHDHIELPDSKPLTLLALSHALAQSTKLSMFEEQAQQTIERTSSIPRSLAQTGSTSLSQRDAAKMRGELFLTKSEILLKYELLDTPEFFWEYPELQPIYEVGASYLEIRQRTEMLSLKLETIHELFEVLADDLKHRHSSRLEWIIIWLIAVEIIIFLVNDFILAQ